MSRGPEDHPDSPEEEVDTKLDKLEAEFEARLFYTALCNRLLVSGTCHHCAERERREEKRKQAEQAARQANTTPLAALKVYGTKTRTFSNINPFSPYIRQRFQRH